MNLKTENFGTGWVALNLQLSSDEAVRLISCLERLRASKLEHFVIASRDDTADGGIESIEISLAATDRGNMQLLDQTHYPVEGED